MSVECRVSRDFAVLGTLFFDVEFGGFGSTGQFVESVDEVLEFLRYDDVLGSEVQMVEGIFRFVPFGLQEAMRHCFRLAFEHICNTIVGLCLPLVERTSFGGFNLADPLFKVAISRRKDLVEDLFEPRP